MDANFCVIFADWLATAKMKTSKNLIRLETFDDVIVMHLCAYQCESCCVYKMVITIYGVACMQIAFQLLVDHYRFAWALLLYRRPARLYRALRSNQSREGLEIFKVCFGTASRNWTVQNQVWHPRGVTIILWGCGLISYIMFHENKSKNFLLAGPEAFVRKFASLKFVCYPVCAYVVYGQKTSSNFHLLVFNLIISLL